MPLRGPRRVRIREYVPNPYHKTVGLDLAYKERIEAFGSIEVFLLMQQTSPPDPNGDNTVWRGSLDAYGYSNFYIQQKHLEFLDGPPPKNTTKEDHEASWAKYRQEQMEKIKKPIRFT